MDGYCQYPPYADYFAYGNHRPAVALGTNPEVPPAPSTGPSVVPNGPGVSTTQSSANGWGEWLDPVEQMEQEMLDMVAPLEPLPAAGSTGRSHQPTSFLNQHVHADWKPASSIPPDLSSANYAAQCIAAAESSRMPPFKLSPGEYNVLRQKLSMRNVTTYLNIRNGILRLWLANPSVGVTMTEAAGCVRDARYYHLAEFAFEWLVRNGYINHGCFPRAEPYYNNLTDGGPSGRRPRQTIAVIGAGVAGLSAARQLEALVRRYPNHWAEYEDFPRIVVLEARRRIGGRIYSPRLSSVNAKVDLGADTVLGFGNGNPLGVVLRRQLGIPVVALDTTADILYNGVTGKSLSESADYRAHRLFNHLLDRMRPFESGMQSEPPGASGDKTLIQAGRNPEPDDGDTETIAHVEQRTRPYTTPAPESNGTVDTSVELAFLRELGYSTATGTATERIDVHAEPAGGVGTGSLGLTMRALVDQLRQLADLDEVDMAALDWYYAKFEFNTGDDISKQGLSSWSHHRRNRFSGRHAWARDGLGALCRALDTTPTKLDVRFNTPVTVIEYDDDSATVGLENGDQINADRVVVTVPLGVLKKRSMQFIPDLPQWKSDSIGRLAFGVVNKVCLVFDKLFWGEDTSPLIRDTPPGMRGDCFMFQNLARKDGNPVIVGLVSGEAAATLPSRSDREIVDDAVARLRRIFKSHPHAQSAKLVESIVTRWQLDPYSRGAFSHVGTEGTVVDHDLLGRPVGQTLFFAGEATSRLYPGTVHGAYLSGLRAAKEVINSMLGPIEVPDLTQSSQHLLSLGPLTSVSSTSGEPTPTGIPQPAPHATSIQPHRVPSRQALRQPSQPHAQGRHQAHPATVTTPIPLATEAEESEQELLDLRRRRKAAELEQMERELVTQLGEAPIRPERIGTTNPFLLFQKDYWAVCREETETTKQRDRKGGHATRNEIRVTLGKKWRSLPAAEKQPYVDRSQRAKDSNEQKTDEYLRQLRFYEAEAENFRAQWQQDHPSTPSARELQLESRLDELRPRRKRIRIRE